MGIDAAPFWQSCYYHRMPVDYQETRTANPLDLLTSGLFAADIVATMSQTYRQWLMDPATDAGSLPLLTTLRKKEGQGSIATIASIPDPSFNPSHDLVLLRPTTLGSFEIIIIAGGSGAGIELPRVIDEAWIT